MISVPLKDLHGVLEEKFSEGEKNIAVKLYYFWCDPYDAITFAYKHDYSIRFEGDYNSALAIFSPLLPKNSTVSRVLATHPVHSNMPKESAHIYEAEDFDSFTQRHSDNETREVVLHNVDHHFTPTSHKDDPCQRVQVQVSMN